MLTIGHSQIDISLADFTAYVRLLGFRQALRHEGAEVVVYQIKEGSHLLLLPTTEQHPSAHALVAQAMHIIEDNDLAQRRVRFYDLGTPELRRRFGHLRSSHQED